MSDLSPLFDYIFLAIGLEAQRHNEGIEAVFELYASQRHAGSRCRSLVPHVHEGGGGVAVGMGGLEGGLANEPIAVLGMEFGLAAGGAFEDGGLGRRVSVGELVKAAIVTHEQFQRGVGGGDADEARVR